MFYSLRYSNLILRGTLALVFLWFGVDKWIHPNYWVQAWVPDSIIHLMSYFHISGVQLVYAVGVFEILAGISFLTNIFIEAFTLVAVVFLVVVSVFQGFNEVLVRDIGLAGALLALFFWPRKRF
ncbi:DoxX family membrane protein [Candidatus Parcubacteria bacterium]|nr:DoxX family membrane protein [Candidatus Parcubacteria bacterium]